MALRTCWGLGLAAGALVQLTVGANADSSVSQAVAQYLVARAAAGSSLPDSAPQAFDLTALSVPLAPPPGLALRLTGSRWDALLRQLEFRLECSTAGACRPFLATLRTHDDKIPREMLGLLSNTSAEKEFTEKGLAVGVPGTPRRVRKTVTRPQPLVRAGEHVRLVVTGPGIRMKIPAVCLEPGALGQTIRARSLEGPKVFHAQVVGAGLLTTVF